MNVLIGYVPVTAHASETPTATSVASGRILGGRLRTSHMNCRYRQGADDRSGLTQKPKTQNQFQITRRFL